ncbi:MAG TPA: hypothetical protein GX728_02510 [Clostridiaceae bacterium]|mgnify:CR=1 FL=1|nr:hypothetical protein [Clostridiaceae bacterium]
MFGYVRPEKPELLMRDFTLYKAVYCGLCKAIGKRIGQLQRFTVSYDMTFLALLLLAFSTVEPDVRHEGCVLNPFKKKAIAADHHVLDYAADLSCLLAYESMRDDAQDDKPIRGRVLSLLLRHSANKAVRARPAVASYIRDELKQLEEIEKGRSSRDPADCFGDILGCLFEDGFDVIVSSEDISERGQDGVPSAPRWYESEQNADLYRTLLGDAGRALGRWVYLVDALDDLEDDRAKNNWNPLLSLENGSKIAEMRLIEAEEAIDRNLALLTYERYGGLVYNIVTLGLPMTRGRVVAGEPLPNV